MLITLNGIDGSGKTSLAAFLVKWLHGRGHAVDLTAEPTQRPIGALIRKEVIGRSDGVAEQSIPLLFAADRIDHAHQVIQPALKAGRIVVCDRYRLTTRAYQEAAARRGGWASWLHRFCDLYEEAVPVPDVDILVRVTPAVAAERRAARLGLTRGDEHFDAFESDLEVQRIAADIYDQAFEQIVAQGRGFVLDGTLDQAKVVKNAYSALMERGL